MNILKIYGSSFWHEDILIVGDTKSLTSLKIAIEDALQGKTGTTLAFENDGEGYVVKIKLNNDEKVFDQLPLHYIDDVAGELEKSDKWKYLSDFIYK